MLLVDVGEFEADDADDDEKDRDESNDVIGIAEEDDAAYHSSCGANARPNGVGGTDRNALHRLGD